MNTFKAISTYQEIIFINRIKTIGKTENLRLLIAIESKIPTQKSNGDEQECHS